jgi:hypothetical protein
MQKNARQSQIEEIAWRFFAFIVISPKAAGLPEAKLPALPR